jgi:DNA-directed RNA polymerase specialized sigma24 family protein
VTIRQRIGTFVPILQAVIGDDFPGVMAAAQQGSEAAFSVLWRDGHPDLLRYLRVAAPEATEDVASETWVQVCRGLPGFRGDEQAWRAWLFTIARRRAIDEGRRRSRHPVAPLGWRCPPIRMRPRITDGPAASQVTPPHDRRWQTSPPGRAPPGHPPAAVR